MGINETVLPNSVRTDTGTVKSILIAIPLTRKWAVPHIIKQFNEMGKFTDISIEVLVFIDNADITEAYVVNQFEKHEFTLSYYVKNTNRKAPQEVRIYYRRERIKEMLTMMQKYIKQMPKQYDMLFMVEDDTIIKEDALQRLLIDWRELHNNNVKVGLIEGVQVGRHGIRMIGAWRTDNIDNPTKMATLPFNKSSFFEKIDGGGLYCFITPMHLFLEHTFYWHGECFSVDVTYGLELRRKGYTNLIDWTVVTGHRDAQGNVLYPNENCTVASYEKQDDGEWKLQA